MVGQRSNGKREKADEGIGLKNKAVFDMLGVAGAGKALGETVEGGLCFLCITGMKSF